MSHEGEIVYTASGWGRGTEQELAARIYSAVKAAKQSAKSG